MKIGNGRGGNGGYTKRKIFKLKDGDQVYRILPGIGDLADSNRWSVHYGVHWGYSTTDGKKKPFASPEKKNRETKMVEIPDAAKERLETLKAKLEEAKKTGNKAVVDRLNPLVGREGLYNLDSAHHLNVIDANGNIGVLQIRHKCKVVLDALIKKLEASEVYPLSPEDGRYFVFTRTGTNNETSFGVSVLQEEISVPGIGKVKKDVSHSLNDEIVSRLKTEAAELDKLFFRPTAEQVAEIVKTSDLGTGKSTYLDTLFAKNAAATPTASDDDHGGDDDSDDSSTAETTSAKQTTDTMVNFVEDTVAVAAKTTVVTPVTPSSTKKATETKVTPKAKTQDVTQLSDAEFMDALNNGTL